MVTLPGLPHRHRDIAEGFGTDAERYDRARPRYPHDLADIVLDGLPGRRVLDVGVGTGISSLPFLAAGCTVLGVEADDRMAALARSRGIPVEVARFEEWDPDGRRFDVILSGQTWHWIDPVAGAERAAEALPVGGRIALFWNAGDPPADIAAGFAAAYDAVDTGLPFSPKGGGGSAIDGYSAMADAAAAGLQATGAFDAARPFRLEWEARITREAWLYQLPTAGGHNRIPEPALAQLLDAMGAVIDAAGGEFTMRYGTVGIMADRLP